MPRRKRLAHAFDNGLVELEYAVRLDRVSEQRANSGGGLLVPPGHTIAKTVRLVIPEQGLANVVRPGNEDQVLAISEPGDDRVVIFSEGGAISLAA